MQKIVLGLGVSGTVVAAAIATTVVLLSDNDDQDTTEDSNMLNVALKIERSEVAVDFGDTTSAPSEIMDYINGEFLKSDETLEGITGVANYEDGTITTIVSYRAEHGGMKTQVFLFGGWEKTPRIDRGNTRLQSDLFGMVPALPREPMDKKYQAKFRVLKAARKNLLDKISTWKIPTKEIMTNPVSELNKVITEFSSYVNPDNLNSGNVNPGNVLQMKKDRLVSIMIEPRYLSTHGEVITLVYPTYTRPTLMGATLSQVEQFIVSKTTAQSAAHLYNEKLKEADRVVVDIYAPLKRKVPKAPVQGNKDPDEHESLVIARIRIISKIENNSIKTMEELKVENDKYITLISNFNKEQSYGLVPWWISDPSRLIQQFYYHNTNLEKFRAAFPGVGVITPTSADGVAEYSETLPNGFRLPSAITNLGAFGGSLTSLPQNFTLPSSVTNLGGFDPSLGGFGLSLTSLLQNFKIPTLVTHLRYFGLSLTSLP